SVARKSRTHGGFVRITYARKNDARGRKNTTASTTTIAVASSTRCNGLIDTLLPDFENRKAVALILVHGEPLVDSRRVDCDPRLVRHAGKHRGASAYEHGTTIALLAHPRGCREEQVRADASSRRNDRKSDRRRARAARRRARAARRADALTRSLACIPS